MQYPSGGIRPKRTGRQRFVLLPGYERGGWRIRWWLSERNWLVVARTLWLEVLFVNEEWPFCCLSPNVASFLDAAEDALVVKTAPFLSASMIRDATAADSRARARNGSGREIAAPLLLLFSTSARGRWVNQRTGREFYFLNVAFLFRVSVSSAFPFAVWRYGAQFWRENVWQSSGTLPGQPLRLPLGHNNNCTWKLALANVSIWTGHHHLILVTFCHFAWYA